jgi:hypothetical protein
VRKTVNNNLSYYMYDGVPFILVENHENRTRTQKTQEETTNLPEVNWQKIAHTCVRARGSNTRRLKMLRESVCF